MNWAPALEMVREGVYGDFIFAPFHATEFSHLVESMVCLFSGNYVSLFLFTWFTMFFLETNVRISFFV